MRKLLLASGLGDLVAVESFMPPKRQVAKLYYACRHNDEAEQLFSLLYPEAEHVRLKGDWFQRNYSKAQVARQLPELPDDWQDVEDWSVFESFQNINRHLHTLPHKPTYEVEYKGTGFNRMLCPMPRDLDLTYYFVVQPATVNDPTRRLTQEDWQGVQRIIEEWNMPAVVLDSEPCPNPGIYGLVTWQAGKTTAAESVEITKHAQGYVGIDSWLSIVASKFHQPERLRIKTNNEAVKLWQEVYFAPHREAPFLVERIA